MKANEAPEKLYGCYKGNGNLFVDYRPFPNDESVEYIRTDAFIKKAKSWFIQQHTGMWNEFKNYMKKE